MRLLIAVSAGSLLIACTTVPILPDGQTLQEITQRVQENLRISVAEKPGQSQPERVEPGDPIRIGTTDQQSLATVLSPKTTEPFAELPPVGRDSIDFREIDQRVAELGFQERLFPDPIMPGIGSESTKSGISSTPRGEPAV